MYQVEEVSTSIFHHVGFQLLGSSASGGGLQCWPWYRISEDATHKICAVMTTDFHRCCCCYEDTTQHLSYTLSRRLFNFAGKRSADNVLAHRQKCKQGYWRSYSNAIDWCCDML